MVVIASAPEWAPMFESEKLGYVNFENAWRLTQFSPEEALELVRKRLLIAGKPIDDVFAPGVIGLINKMEGGNPRRILRRCSNLTESAATKGIRPISKEFILKHHSAKVENDLAKLMWNLASKSEAHKQALGAIYFFYETMEREALDVDKGWSAFLQLTEGEVPVSRLDPDYVTSLASVSDRVQQEGQEPSRRLKKNVAEYLREWSTDGLSPADFVSFFRVKPVHPKEFNVEILRQVRASALPEDVRWYVEGARGHYKQATDDNVFPTKVVDLSWRAVEYLLKGYLIKAGAVKEGAFSDDKIGEDRYLDNYGRLRWKKPERLVAEARAIFGKFTDLKNAKGLYVKTYDQMRLL